MKLYKTARSSYEIKGDLVSDELAVRVQKSQHQKYLALGLDTVCKSVNAAARTIEFVASTETPDRYGDVIQQSGWQLDNYRQNPVILFSHDSNALPVGKALNVKVTKNRLIATIEFASKDVNPLADTIFKLYREDFMRAVSVGFLPLDYDINFSDDGAKAPLGLKFKSVELLEISCVSIPANPQALAVDNSADIPEALEKLLAAIHGKPSKRDALGRILDAVNDMAGD